MIFILLSIPFILLAGFIWKKYRELIWGTQSWHIPFFYGLSFTGFVFLFLGVISYMYGKGENETIVVSDKGCDTKEELNSLSPDFVKSNMVNLSAYSHKRDTIELFPYIYSILARELGIDRLIIPVILKDKNEFYLFRSNSADLLLPCKDTKIEHSSVKNILVIESIYINRQNSKEKVILKQRNYVVKLKQQYLLLHYHKTDR